MSQVFGEYGRDRGLFLWGLSVGQVLTIGVAALPGVVVWGCCWVVVVVLVVVPARGRSAAQWALAWVACRVGALAGWTRWQSRIAAGRPGPDGELDLPGVLSGLRVHEGPPLGARMRRVAVIQDVSRRTWAGSCQPW